MTNEMLFPNYFDLFFCSHYLHLPVSEKDNSIVGMVDILMLSYKLLLQSDGETHEDDDGEGAASEDGELLVRITNCFISFRV